MAPYRPFVIEEAELTLCDCLKGARSARVPSYWNREVAGFSTLRMRLLRGPSQKSSGCGQAFVREVPSYSRCRYGCRDRRCVERHAAGHLVIGELRFVRESGQSSAHRRPFLSARKVALPNE